MYERFGATLIRASMMKDAKILIISALQQFHTHDTIGDVLELISILKLEERVIFLDLMLNEIEYKDKGITCHII